MKTDNMAVQDVLPHGPGNDRHGGAKRVLTVNGEQRKSAAPDLAALLAELDIDASTVVAEHNGRIVEHACFSGALLSDGDVVELVRFVGGG